MAEPHVNQLVALDAADTDILPPLVQDLVSLVGFTATLNLVIARPGVRVFVPTKLYAEHWLVGVMGPAAAEKLVKVYAGDELTIPNCKRALSKIQQRHIVRSRMQDGHSQRETALMHGVTPRWVRKLETREPEEDRNGSLF